MTEALRDRAVDIDGLSFAYDERVLEPRPWTAAQSAWAAELLDDLPLGPVLELCSGAGHIGLLAVRSHDRRLVQVDASEAACDFARAQRRARRAGRPGAGPVRADGRGRAARRAVPPGPRRPALGPDRGVEEFPDDPVTAIDGGDQGMDVALACVDLAGRVLTPAGVCLLQLGTSEQADEVAAYVDRARPPVPAGGRGADVRARPGRPASTAPDLILGASRRYLRWRPRGRPAATVGA